MGAARAKGKVEEIGLAQPPKPGRRRGRTVTLRGEACRSYIEAQKGIVPVGEYEQALRVATIVHLYMGQEDEGVAIMLLKRVAKNGLAVVAEEVCTGLKGGDE